MFKKIFFCCVCVLSVLNVLYADETDVSSNETLSQRASKTISRTSDAFSDFSKDQLRKELEKEREHNRQLLRENHQLKESLETIRKCLSEFLQIHISQNPSTSEINSEIRIKLDNQEPVPNILSEDDFEYVKEMLSDDPKIVKSVERYHHFIQQLKKKKIIILEDKK